MMGSNPCRCAQLIETLDVGGAENLAVRIANAMAAAGHASHLLVMSRAGALKAFVSPQVTLHELAVERMPIGRPTAFLGSLRSGLARLESVIGDQRIEVVQAHLPGANFWGLLLTMRRRVAIVSTIHNNQEFRYGDVDNSVRAFLRKRAYAQVVARGAATVAVSAEVRESLIRDLGLPRRTAARIVAIPNGVVVPEPVPAAQRRAAREHFQLDQNAFVFLAAGRHCEQKNFADLVRAASRLDVKGRKWRLVIAGDGPDRPALAALVRELGLSDSVTLPGNVLELPRLMSAVDAFVMPSLWEGLPLVLLEAMAFGLPVVGTRIPGIADVVRDGREGLLVDAADPVQFAAAMSRLVQEPESCSSFGAAGRDLVSARFDFAKTVGSLSELYARCRAGQAPGGANV